MNLKSDIKLRRFLLEVVIKYGILLKINNFEIYLDVSINKETVVDFLIKYLFGIEILHYYAEYSDDFYDNITTTINYYELYDSINNIRQNPLTDEEYDYLKTIINNKLEKYK